MITANLILFEESNPNQLNYSLIHLVTIITPSLTLTADRESVVSDDLRAEEKVQALTQTWV